MENTSAVFQTWVDLAIKKDIEEQRMGASDDESYAEADASVRSFAQQAPSVLAEWKTGQTDLRRRVAHRNPVEVGYRTWFIGLTAGQRLWSWIPPDGRPQDTPLPFQPPRHVRIGGSPIRT